MGWITEIRGRQVTCTEYHGEKADRNDRSTERQKLSVSTACSGRSGKNRRRGGCSYGCARLCNFGKQIAAIKTRNMETFGLMQQADEKKASKTIHKLEDKSRTRIRLRSLLGDLGRRSSWALGVGQSRPGRNIGTPQRLGMV